MDIQHVPPALQERLGPEGALGLVNVVHLAGRTWKDDVMSAASDRFERRLVEETGRLRVDMAGLEGRLVARIAEARNDVLQWSFVFWIGQVITLTTIMSVLLRGA